MTVDAPPGKRLQCARCIRPASACICHFITPAANDVEVLILQHPQEVHQAKGSVRLLQLSLQRICVLVGEVFEPEVLRAALSAPLADGRPAGNVLLYPEPAGPASGSTLHEPVPPRLTHEMGLRLVAMDGTWRKSLKMLHLNPALQALPRMALQPEAPSRYIVRKAHQPHQLSTLEACCSALAQIENAPERYEKLLKAFDSMVALQQARMASRF